LYRIRIRIRIRVRIVHVHVHVHVCVCVCGIDNQRKFANTFLSLSLSLSLSIYLSIYLIYSTEGRDGKGIIYVFAAGNENKDGDDTNFQPYGANTRFTMPVAAVGKSGSVSVFSTPGASVFIAGPGGDPRQAHTTVIAAVNGGKCSDAGDGTSYSAPG
jgi:hypothetical protein